ncbi:hypothetical protein Ae201684P_009926 [Aphanomyces euteiches]|nr:hypothetical protein Ae201684P_009926 [Aphanomyces euteiches]
MLAAQCFVSSACIVYWSTNRDIDAKWHHLYVLAMGTKAVLGGILHYMVFKAMHHFNIQLAKVARRVFGLYLKQSTVDCPHLSKWTIWVTGIEYSLVGIAAFIKMQTSIMLLGFMPPMLFGGIFALTTLDKGWLCEILVLVFIFIGGVIQAIEASPSHKHFNHNALAHVFLSASATTMMMHFHLAVA